MPAAVVAIMDSDDGAPTLCDAGALLWMVERADYGACALRCPVSFFRSCAPV